MNNRLDNKFTSQRGMALLSAVFYALAFVAIATGSFHLIKRHSKASDSQDEYQEIEMLRKTILDYVDCRQTLGVANSANPPVCKKGQPIVLKDKSGTPIFPLSADGKKQITSIISAARQTPIPAWEISTSCDGDVLQVKRRSLVVGKDGILRKSDVLWPDSEDPKLCSGLLAGENPCSGKYDIYAGQGRFKPTCCRLLSGSGNGSATARCGFDEFLLSGGAWCGSAGDGDKKSLDKDRRNVSRCLVSESVLAIGDPGQGSARGISMTAPSLGLPPPGIHTDPAYPAVMQAKAMHPKTKEMMSDPSHGGFLLQSGHSSLNSQAAIDSWVASCKVDDWEGLFPTVARGYCCPKQP